MEEQIKHDIFVSYSRRDKNAVIPFCKDLERAGISYWIDIEGNYVGEKFKHIISDAIENCRVVLFFSSENSNASPWTEKEINLAVYCKKPIIPIKLDDKEYNKHLRFDLVGLDYISANEINCKAKLVERIGDIVGGTGEIPIEPEKDSNLLAYIKNTCFALQYFIFGIFFLASMWLFFDKPIPYAQVGRYFNAILALLFLGTIILTYYLYLKRKWAFWSICFLDVLSLIIFGYTATVMLGTQLDRPIVYVFHSIGHDLNYGYGFRDILIFLCLIAVHCISMYEIVFHKKKT